MGSHSSFGANMDLDQQEDDFNQGSLDNGLNPFSGAGNASHFSHGGIMGGSGFAGLQRAIALSRSADTNSRSSATPSAVSHSIQHIPSHNTTFTSATSPTNLSGPHPGLQTFQRSLTLPQSANTSGTVTAAHHAHPTAPSNLAPANAQTTTEAHPNRIDTAAETSEATEHTASQATASLPTPTWDASISDMQSAARYLSGEGAACLEINPENDDVDQVDQETLQHAQKIFNAILVTPTKIPDNLDEKYHDAWWAKQKLALEECEAEMKSADDVKNACALSMLVVDKAMTMHEHGIPMRHLEESSAARVVEGVESGDRKYLASKKPAFKAKSKYAIDRLIKCSERIDKVVEAVRDNKRVAFDLLNGEDSKIADMVRAPTAYVRQKCTLFKSNEIKAAMLSDGRRFRAAHNSGQATAMTNDGEDVNVGDEAEDEEADAEAVSDDE